ncbi:class I SAM-dependent methyltransferase [Pseudomonas auratipiscis]|uniref:Class I SAM-dependent methyltransferase n=1 Tax=Pseudomonas auratipiscis TaxID=3115853 RepID=A0AB35X0V0_9PSED|nr:MULTISPECIES: class I SAM-dependent methyltransferase [unclassified Pseudomonas]MEE1869172.1 class I SAM-dependent methyltransferase [Pseudomonas sp. 120P]MEE1959926.1 class I SAM-dependent methyltransferase [Pseudomonas sp. 119P]
MNDEISSQANYHLAAQKIPVYAHLRQAVEQCYWAAGSRAIDVGCGAGRDSRYLLEQGFVVHAFDQDANALAHLQDLNAHPRLKVHQSSFDAFDYPQADLITACSSLFFCPPQVFPAVWQKIVHALRPNGVFCGHFMGPEDSWAQLQPNDLSVHEYEQVEQLMRGFEVLDVYEHNQPGQTLLGKRKHWHSWSVLARKTDRCG